MIGLDFEQMFGKGMDRRRFLKTGLAFTALPFIPGSLISGSEDHRWYLIYPVDRALNDQETKLFWKTPQVKVEPPDNFLEPEYIVEQPYGKGSLSFPTLNADTGKFFFKFNPNSINEILKTARQEDAVDATLKGMFKLVIILKPQLPSTLQMSILLGDDNPLGPITRMPPLRNDGIDFRAEHSIFLGWNKWKFDMFGWDIPDPNSPLLPSIQI